MLPPEIVRLIFQYTDYVEAVCLSLTCKALYGFHFELRIEDSPNPHLLGSQYLTDYYDNNLAYNVVLRRQLRGLMGPNFVYNPYVGRFTTYKRLSEIHCLVREEVRREQSLVQRLARWAKNDKKLFRGRERILHERRVEAVEER